MTTNYIFHRFPSCKEQLKQCKPLSSDNISKLSKNTFDVYSYSGHKDIQVGDKLLYAIFNNPEQDKHILLSLSEEEAKQRGFL